MFRVPSSSPPSTPDSRRSRRDVPSTTPAGPPPDRSLMPSSTPAGPPPRSLFGGPRFSTSNANAPLFSKAAFGSSPPKNELVGVGSNAFGVSTTGRPPSQRGRSGYGYGVPSSTPPPPGESDGEEAEDDEEEDVDDEEYDDEAMEDEDAEGEEHDDEDMDEDGDEESGEEPEDATGFAPSQSRSLSQSLVDQQPPSPSIVRTDAKQSQFDLLNLAKGLSPNNDRAVLRESNDVILETERLMERLSGSVADDSPDKREAVLAEVAQALVALWQTSSTGSFAASSHSARLTPTASASRLANLLLNIRYPNLTSQNKRSSKFSIIPMRSERRHFTPIPKVLIDWLNTYHGTISEVGLVLKETRGYSAHPSFWDAVHVSACRGNFATTLKLLKGARFDVAESASEDKLGSTGYRGSDLANTNTVVQAAINLLYECPAVAFEDWDVKGQDWAVFRRRAQQAFNDLKEFAEGESQNRHNLSRSFQASHFGMSRSQSNFNLSIASRKAESKVPWSIYENLNRFYMVLLGNEEEIVALSADWIEAVMNLTIWWSGEEDATTQGSLAASRRSVARSQRLRPVDVTPVQAYCQRLTSSLATIFESDDDDLNINTTDAFEVGLACIFDNNVEGVLQILRSRTLSLASAIAEIASIGDWFPKGDGIFDQFDQSDLMVLSYTNQRHSGFTKDDLLVSYATALSKKDKLNKADDGTVQEGWELAIQILGRLNDPRTINTQVETILDDLDLQSSERVDKVIRLCHNLGLSDQARRVALKYAEHLRHNTQNYGDTLLYYAKAHEADKTQEMLRALVAHSLVKSSAYPAVAELDDSLNSLIASPKQTLTDIARSDPEGAHLLSNYLSGYATIRKFYDLRDEEIFLEDGEKAAHRPMARKRAAANALMTIISSAASSIRGGLYDPEVETVVQVDVLLTLLGEALMFVHQPKRTLTLHHLYSLLAAVEDLDTAPSMIRNQAEECLLTTLATAHEGSVPSPRSLHKSTSNLTSASSQYSIIDSIHSGSAEGHSTDSSTVLVKGGKVDEAKRGWDWRKGFGKNATGQDVIRVLRLGIAKELGRAFAEGEV